MDRRQPQLTKPKVFPDATPGRFNPHRNSEDISHSETEQIEPMPEQAEQQPTEAEVVETTTEAPDTADVTTSEKPTTKPAETVDFWKQKAREQEKRAKENAAKAAEFDKAAEAQKTEQQRLIERAEAAERRAAELETAQQIDGWKTEIADSKEFEEITAEQRARIVKSMRGTSQEELLEHARDLKALLPQPRQPGQVLTEGRTVNAGNNDPAQQFANIITNARRG